MFWNKKESENQLPDLPQSNTQTLSRTTAPIPDLPNTTQEVENRALPSFPDSLSDKGFSQTAIKDAVVGNQEDVGSPRPQNFKLVEIHDPSGTDNDLKPSLSSIMSNESAVKETPQEKSALYSAENLYQQTIPNKPSPPQITKSVDKKEEEIPAPYVPKVLPIPKFQKIEEPVHRESYHEERSKEISKPIQKQRDPLPKPFQRPENRSENVFVKIDKFYAAKKALDSAKQQLLDVEEYLRKIREVKLREEQELDAWEKEILNAKSYVQEVNDNVFDKLE